MRKIVCYTVMNSKTFQPETKMMQQTDNGEVITLFHAPVVPMPNPAPPKYTLAEQGRIIFCNKILTEQGQDELTEDEIEFMLDPGYGQKRLSALAAEMEDLEVLQRMAGFTMEKVAKPTTTIKK